MQRDSTVAPLLMSPTQVAGTLNCGLTKVYELINSGVLERVYIGASPRIKTDSVQRVVDQGVPGPRSHVPPSPRRKARDDGRAA